MNTTPENYTKFDSVPGQFSNNLFKLFKDNSNYDIVLDIGCGNGGLTKRLAENVKHKRIIGIDIDPNMISFANQYNKTDSIEYWIQDMRTPFDQLIPELKQLKSKVSLIFANCFCNWIPNRKQLFENLSKLLANKASIYASTPIFSEVRMYLSDDKIALFDKYFDIGSGEEEMSTYKRAIIQNGLNIELFNKIIIKSPPNLSSAKGFVPIIHECLKKYLKTPIETDFYIFENHFIDAIERWTEIIYDETLKIYRPSNDAYQWEFVCTKI